MSIRMIQLSERSPGFLLNSQDAHSLRKSAMSVEQIKNDYPDNESETSVKIQTLGMIYLDPRRFSC